MNDEIESKNKLWDKYYKTYKPTILGSIMYNSHRKVLKRVMKDLSRDINIIDVGCGQGSTLSSFREWGFLNSIGIDLSTSGLEECEKVGLKLNIDVFLMDGTTTSFPDRNFSLLFSEGTLEHYEDFMPFVKEWCRIADDKIIIIQPNHFCLYSRLIQLGWKMFRQNSGGVKELTYRLESFYDAFEKYGFEHVSTHFTTLKENAVLVFKRSLN